MGKNLSEERKLAFIKKKEQMEEESILPFKGELEKTEKTEEIINFINNCLKKEFDEMGLKYENIPSEKVHLFLDDIFRKMHPESTASGIYSSILHEAHIRVGCSERANIFTTILHEMIHIASYNVYYANTNNEDLSDNYRTGYANAQHQGQNFHEHFRGLNEGIIDLIASEILNKNLETISEMLDLEEEDYKSINWYYDEGELINAIIEKVAKQKNEDEDDVYMRFKKGLFSGEMMHLRDVEKVFGKDALRIFSYVDPKAKSKKEIEIQGKVYEFFLTDNQERKNQLHAEIIQERSL